MRKTCLSSEAEPCSAYNVVEVVKKFLLSFLPHFLRITYLLFLDNFNKLPFTYNIYFYHLFEYRVNTTSFF